MLALAVVRFFASRNDISVKPGQSQFRGGLQEVMMDDQQVEEYLRRIGKRCFVTFFGELSDFELSNETVARYIAEDGNRDYSAALTWRVNPARRIIRGGKAREALIICSKSRGLPVGIRNKAAECAESLVPATPPVPH